MDRINSRHLLKASGPAASDAGYSKQYLSYLNSPEWALKRKKRLEIDGYTCCGCGCAGTPDNPLQVHHLCGYRMLGHENEYTQLVTVCERCHTIIHNVMSRKIDVYGTRSWREYRAKSER